MGLKPRDDLSYDFVESLLRYDRRRGLLFWKPRPSSPAWNARYAGKVAGRKTGYAQVQIYGVCYQAHRIIWLLEKGQWPNGEIDHRNRKKNKNNFTNLREANPSQNAQNKKQYKNNKSGHVGVSWINRGQRWQATIQISSKSINLGWFKKKSDAIAAYVIGKKQFHTFNPHVRSK